MRHHPSAAKTVTGQHSLLDMHQAPHTKVHNLIRALPSQLGQLQHRCLDLETEVDYLPRESVVLLMSMLTRGLGDKPQ